MKGVETCDANLGCQPGTAPCDPNTTTCDEANDTCVPIDLCANVDCDPTANPCTENVCDPADGTCNEQPLPNGTSCSDGDVCNGEET